MSKETEANSDNAGKDADPAQPSGPALEKQVGGQLGMAQLPLKPFPLLQSLSLLLGTTILFLVGAHSVGLDKLNLGPDFGKLLILSAVVAFFCGAILFLMIKLATMINFTAALFAALAGMFSRIIITITFCLIAYKTWDFSPKALVISQAIFYLPMLLVETTVIGRYFWQDQAAIKAQQKTIEEIQTQTPEHLQTEVSA